MRTSILAVLLPACAVYRPGSFVDVVKPMPGTRLTTSCLDVAIAAVEDSVATGSVIQYSFGNRCLHATVVDLASIRATGRMSDGSTIELHARDPRRELRPLPLEVLWQGTEKIEYLSATGVLPLSICLDLTTIERNAPSPRQVCVGATS